MQILPTGWNWASFIWGACIGTVTAFGAGFLQKAGEHFFDLLKNKVSPPPLEPKQLGGSFIPTTYQPGDCAWIRDYQLYDYEQKGYFYYPHPEDEAKCYRVTSDGTKPVKEFLMVKLDAQRVL